MEMRLHKDKDAFQALCSVIAENTGIREDIIEKDYYLTLVRGSFSLGTSILLVCIFYTPVLFSGTLQPGANRFSGEAQD